MSKQQEILRFISLFEEAKNIFLYGLCYWFAFILQGRFGGTMMYEPIINHFVQEIDGRLYDASGDVTEEYSTEHLMPWSSVEEYDCLEYQRLLKYCVRKDDYDD